MDIFSKRRRGKKNVKFSNAVIFNFFKSLVTLGKNIINNSSAGPKLRSVVVGKSFAKFDLIHGNRDTATLFPVCMVKFKETLSTLISSRASGRQVERSAVTIRSRLINPSATLSS
jgi:hypothetical protein